MWKRLARALQRCAIPDLTRILVAGQILFYVADRSGMIALDRCAFVPALALAGEWWRFATFLFIPPLTNPLFALFGPALGMTAIIPDMDPTRPAQVDPAKIVEAIENFGVTNMFGSPAVIRRVGRHGEQSRLKLPSLRRVISAGAPVPASGVAPSAARSARSTASREPAKEKVSAVASPKPIATVSTRARSSCARRARRVT